MKRRSFFTLLAGAVSAPVIVPTLCAKEEIQTPPAPDSKQPMSIQDFLKQESERIGPDMLKKVMGSYHGEYRWINLSEVPSSGKSFSGKMG